MWDGKKEHYGGICLEMSCFFYQTRDPSVVQDNFYQQFKNLYEGFLTLPQGALIHLKPFHNVT